MIRYSLRCERGHGFDMWFADSETFDTLSEASHVACPDCGSTAVEKAPMAPGIATKGKPATPAPREMARLISAFREKVMADTTDVGRRFPEQARDMHEGLIEQAPIRGQATPDEAKSLVEDGIAILPVPPEPPKEN